MAKGPKLSPRRMRQIYAAIIAGADLDRCQGIVAALPAGLNIAECIIIAGQIVGNAIAAMPEEQRAEMLQGLFMAISDVVDQRALMAGASQAQH
jgi:hypothetical protein